MSNVKPCDKLVHRFLNSSEQKLHDNARQYFRNNVAEPSEVKNYLNASKHNSDWIKLVELRELNHKDQEQQIHYWWLHRKDYKPEKGTPAYQKERQLPSDDSGDPPILDPISELRVELLNALTGYINAIVDEKMKVKR